MSTITVRYASLDGFRQSRSFKTLAAAQRYAAKWIGSSPDYSVNYNYAVSDDGLGKITSNVPVAELFPAPDVAS